MSQDYIDISLAGSKMTRRAADDLERKVALNPGDEISRIALMGFYPRKAIWNRTDREKSMNHELWFVRNNPGHRVLRFPHCSMIACKDTDLYAKGKTAWLEIVQEDCDNVTIFSHAAAFFCMWDRELAVDLIERARQIEPANNKLLQQLAHVYGLGLIGKHDKSWLQRAFEVHKELVEVEPGDVKQIARFADIALRLGNLNIAKVAAQMILATPHATRPSALYEAHSLLGRIYLREGDMNAAKAELLASGDWPAYALDNAFIAIGERLIVCEHLWRSLPAWKTGKVQLLLWILQLRLGGKPKLGKTWLLSFGIGGYTKEDYF